VRAILAGDKTQTRRVAKGPVCAAGFGYDDDPNMVWFGAYGTRKGCPYGKVGDRLWVRETWEGASNERDAKDPKHPAHCISYRATDGEFPEGCFLKWKPSIHMPRWACRIRLEITNVRLERLLDLTEADARAEGYPSKPSADTLTAEGMKTMGPLVWFSALWERANGPCTWVANPMVWVLEFKVLEGRGA
jgi:hypothetical protein